MDEDKPLLCTYRCNACEYGPCIASCERRPENCLCESIATFDPEWTGATWKRIRNISDDLDELFDWREGADLPRSQAKGAQEEVESRGEYPSWYYDLTYGRQYDGGLIWALRNVVNGAALMENPFDDGKEREATLKRYKKEEIARAFCGYGFGAGLIYGEWRRKVLKEDDWELLDDGTDVD